MINWKWSTEHLTSLQSYCTLSLWRFRVSRIICNSEALYVPIKWIDLLQRSANTHHNSATQLLLTTNFHQSEVSRNMYQFNEISWTIIEIYCLKWTNIHFTLRCSLNQHSWNSPFKESRHTYRSKWSQIWASSKFIIESEPNHTSLSNVHYSPQQ